MLFIIGFFGIQDILIKNLILYPILGNHDLINLLGFKIEISDVITNIIDFCWGALIWNTGKRVFLP